MDLRFVWKGEVQHEVNVFLHDVVRFLHFAWCGFPSSTNAWKRYFESSSNLNIKSC